MATEKRLIDANDACESLCKKCGLDWNECERIGFCADYMDIKRIPTVDAVEVKHGRWIDNIDENGYLCNAWRKCSACGGLNWSKRPNYCPNCGAKMDLED